MLIGKIYEVEFREQANACPSSKASCPISYMTLFISHCPMSQMELIPENVFANS